MESIRCCCAEYCILLLFVLAPCQDPGAAQHKTKSNSLPWTGYRIIAKVTTPDRDSLVQVRTKENTHQMSRLHEGCAFLTEERGVKTTAWGQSEGEVRRDNLFVQGPF